MPLLSWEALLADDVIEELLPRVNVGCVDLQRRELCQVGQGGVVRRPLHLSDPAARCRSSSVSSSSVLRAAAAAMVTSGEGRSTNAFTVYDTNV